MNALEGIKVVSFNHFLMGPAGMQVLGDLGADVIAVEPVGGSFQRQWSGANRKVDGESLLFLCANRNKRSLALDLKSTRQPSPVRPRLSSAARMLIARIMAP